MVNPNDNISSPQQFLKYANAGAYHWLQVRPAFRTTFNPYLHARYQLTLKYCPAPTSPDATAADLGCGDGYFSGQLLERGYRVTGVDGSPEAVKLAGDLFRDHSRKSEIQFQLGNVLATGLADSSVHVITNLDVIEHLNEPEKLLAEIRRIGKPGATALIGTPVRITEKPWDKYHVQEFFPEQFRALLSPYLKVQSLHLSHPVEWLAVMNRSMRIFGRKKVVGWNFVNSVYMLTGRNPFAAENPRFPTYQLAVCRVEK